MTDNSQETLDQDEVIEWLRERVDYYEEWERQVDGDETKEYVRGKQSGLRDAILGLSLGEHRD